MTTGSWAAPTHAERQLYEAGARGDTAGVLEALGRTRLYVLTARLHADAPGFVAPLPTQRDETARRTVVPVLTEGMLPPWHPDWVFQQITLDELAKGWPHDKWWLAVNPDTPYAAALPARSADRRAWAEAAVRGGGPARLRLLTHAGGHLHGPVAQGLALGAHLSVLNGLVWNQLGAQYEDYATDVSRLRRPWGVYHRAGFRETLEALLATRLAGRVPESVLAVRRRTAVRLGVTPTSDEWSTAVAAALDPDGTQPGTRAEAADVQRRIAHYEDRFRADGVLAPDGRVDTIAAFDLGRAVNVVRLALGARYCDPQEAEQSVLRVVEPARQVYGSWADFSLGYLLARLIHFDEGDAEPMYQECLALHRTLTQDPASPYRNIPWS
ncbi:MULTISPECIES: DUF1266 domain-containing protein [Streptomyces]|uniref:DUF1266 domain-containing protein n=1 Tax=Streptomyces solicathayae TaxID=3081768 RepID=A0ABZ0LQY8_9ACTN|nr:DUF1266 domain-containing protein [Streptomyces sp. HUAS YS2]WOX21911.1 DUF1266 domain-containing protein [Streptomyces sp. HUAS YS2]